MKTRWFCSKLTEINGKISYTLYMKNQPENKISCTSDRPEKEVRELISITLSRMNARVFV